MSSEVSLIESALIGLAHFLHSGLQQELEPVRLGRAGYALLVGGCSVKGNFPRQLLASYLVVAQRQDGGWSDVEETLWCLGFLSYFEDQFQEEINRGKHWLALNQLPCGAWGKTNRDQPRIPITALATVLVPEVINKTSLEWLGNQWKSDLESPTQLSYKGAYFLISQKHNEASSNSDLIDTTLNYLVREQSDDGSYGPWKDHPAGSDPWSTGIVLWGLSTLKDQAPKRTIERAASWLESTQLSNGLWPYHYIDNGSAMALIGLSNSLPILMER